MSGRPRRAEADLARAAGAGLLIAALDAGIAAPTISGVFLDPDEWWYFLAATAAVAVCVGFAAHAFARLWGPSVAARGLAVTTAFGLGALAAVDLTAGRRVAESALRLPLILCCALTTAGVAWLLLRLLDRRVGSRPVAVALLGAAALGLILDRIWLPRLYPAWHGMLALGAVAATLTAASIWPRPAPRSWLGRFTPPRRALAAWALLSPLVAAVALLALARHGDAAYAVGRCSPLLGKLVPWVRLEARPLPSHAHLAAGAGRHGVELRTQPDVLLITVDALRADRLGAYGGPGLTPEMDRLAEDGCVFTRAYTATPHTSYALGSLMTGKYLRPLYELGGAHDRQPTLAGTLRRYGYRTAAFYPPAIFFVDGDNFSDFERTGFDFEYRKAMFLDGRRRADQLQAWLDELPEGHPAFAWVHLFEPHEPYDPPEGYARGGDDEGRYDGEVRVADEAVGALVRRFRRARPGATVILTADHGEEFGDHGGRYHGTTLFDEQVRVPLIWSSPGLVPPRRTDAPVELVDLATTLLSALAIPSDVRMRGDDLGALLLGEDAARPAYAFSDLASERLVTDGHLVTICAVRSASCRLYDLDLDPQERRDRSAERPADVARMRAALGAFAASIPRREAMALGDTLAWPAALGQAALGDCGRSAELARLLGSRRVEVRAQAAVALARCGRVDAAGLLSQLADADPSDEVRAEATLAAYTLGEGALGGRVRALLEGARDRGPLDGDFRRRCALALARHGDGAGRELLLETATDPHLEEATRLEALAALGGLPRRGLAARLVPLLDEVRMKVPVAETLGRLGDHGAVPDLRRALASERYVPARAAEAQALYALGDRRVRADVRRFLGMEVPIPGGVRLLERLGDLRPPRAGSLRRTGQSLRGPADCDARGCVPRQGATLELPRRRVLERLVVAVEAPAGGGQLRLGPARFDVPAGDREVSVELSPGPARALSVSGDVRLVAFAIVPAQEEIPPPSPEPWRDAGLDAQGSLPTR